MKPYSFIGFTLCILYTSCKSYEIINPQEYNSLLQYNVTIQNPAEVMELVYPPSTQQGIYIDWKQHSFSKKYSVIVIDTLSVTYPQAIRYKSKMMFNGITWSIESIERSYSSQFDSRIKLWNANFPSSIKD